ncbi:MAG: aldo/keto reductase [Hyphomicrobiales bacterium]
MSRIRPPEMPCLRLGRSGLMISMLVLGTMNLGRPTGKAEAIKMIDAALDAGINILDCADIYAGDHRCDYRPAYTGAS